VLNPDVLFHHTNTQEEIDSARKYNAQFDGIGPSQLDGFAKLLATSKDKLEERFRNIEIRQDGPLGLVTFNYDFVINDKVHHSGLEVWHVCKIDGQTKTRRPAVKPKRSDLSCELRMPIEKRHPSIWVSRSRTPNIFMPSLEAAYSSFTTPMWRKLKVSTSASTIS
jgi:hypothetical protein